MASPRSTQTNKDLDVFLKRIFGDPNLKRPNSVDLSPLTLVQEIRQLEEMGQKVQFFQGGRGFSSFTRANNSFLKLCEKYASQYHVHTETRESQPDDPFSHKILTFSSSGKSTFATFSKWLNTLGVELRYDPFELIEDRADGIYIANNRKLLMGHKDFVAMRPLLTCFHESVHAVTHNSDITSKKPILGMKVHGAGNFLHRNASYGEDCRSDELAGYLLTLLRAAYLFRSGEISENSFKRHVERTKETLQDVLNVLQVLMRDHSLPAIQSFQNSKTKKKFILSEKESTRDVIELSEPSPTGLDAISTLMFRKIGLRLYPIQDEAGAVNKVGVVVRGREEGGDTELELPSRFYGKLSDLISIAQKRGHPNGVLGAQEFSDIVDEISVQISQALLFFETMSRKTVEFRPLPPIKYVDMLTPLIHEWFPDYIPILEEYWKLT